MTRLYFFPLCFYMAGIHLDVVGSNMCDDGWVYYSNTNTCLQAISGVNNNDFITDVGDPCANRTGGEFRNISGQVVKFTEDIEPFLRNYLQFMKVSEAGVLVSPSWLRRKLFVHRSHMEFSLYEDQRIYFVPGKLFPLQGYFSGHPAAICQVKAGPIEPPVCPRDVKLVSVSDRNATLSWSLEQLGREVVVYVTVQICEVPSSCRYFITIPFGDVSLFQLMNYTVSGLQPNTMYKLTLQIQSGTFRNKDCNVTLFLTTKKEPPVCPRDVKLMSVSDRDATISWSHGQLGRNVSVEIKVHICDGVPLPCKYFISYKRSQDTYCTFSSLQPNTMYKLALEIYEYPFGVIECNVTLFFSTKTEPLVCPRDVSLVSVSDTKAVLSWSPGQQGIKSIVKIEVQLCVALSCEYFTTRIFEDKSQFQLMNYTVSGLEPNTKYKLVLQMLNETFETKDCNMTLALQTNEENQGQESTAAVVGLAVISSISLCACSVLAILLFRYHVQAKKDKNSDIDKIVTKIMKTAASNKEAKLQGHKKPETDRDLYVNFRVEPHTYETTIENLDDHFYET